MENQRPETDMADGVGLQQSSVIKGLECKPSPEAPFETPSEFREVQTLSRDERVRRLRVFLNFHSWSLDAQRRVDEGHVPDDESMLYMSEFLERRERRDLAEKMVGYGDD